MKPQRKKLATKSKTTELRKQSVTTNWERDPRYTDTIARGAIVKKTLAGAEGGPLSCRETARLLGISESAVIRRWRTHRIIGWEDGNALYFPVWQFKQRKLLPGIEDVLKIFRSDAHWRVMLYFLANRKSLEMQRPLDLLRRGESDAVIKHASAHLEDHDW